MRFFTLVSALIALPAVLALPATSTDLSALAKRQDCAATCGSICYYQSTIDTAVSNGYSLYENGQEKGRSTYPHAYNNYEGLDLLVDGPYQEYPIMSSSKPYSGGSPGADRVVFNENGELAGVVTHTGASGNNFVSC